jgi:transglutaminase-like putative cysteine protease
MLIRIGYELQFDLTSATHMVLMLHVHPERGHLLQRPERLHVEPHVNLDTSIDTFGNRNVRIMAPPGKLKLWYDNVILDSGRPEKTIDGLRLHPVDELPNDLIRYLMGSRYCEVDRLSPMAWDLFGKTPATHERVQAVMDWVNKHITFGYKFARHNKTAYDTWYEQKGVCRDYQHLAIALLRALNIPARYATGYLGDIGTAPCPLPGDFSAWMEVFVGGQWITLDARHNTPRIGRILMARGRDATDVALTTSFGAAKLCGFKVWTEECTEAQIEQPEAVFAAAPAAMPLAPAATTPAAPAPAPAPNLTPTPTPPPPPIMPVAA